MHLSVVFNKQNLFLQLGNAATFHWLVTFVSAMLQNFLLVTPVKLVAVAAFITYLKRNEFEPKHWLGITSEAERQNALASWRYLQAQFWQEYFSYLQKRSTYFKAKTTHSSLLSRRIIEIQKQSWCYKLPNFRALLSAGKLKIAVSQVKRFWTDMILWIILTGLLASILLLQRDDRVFRLNDLYKTLFLNEFENIEIITDYWKYMENSFLPLVMKESRETKYAKFHKLGAIRVWQVRLNYVECLAKKHARLKLKHCIPGESSVKSFSQFDNAIYDPYWKKRNIDYGDANFLITTPWSYRSFSGTLASSPLLGNYLARPYYPLGGYIVDLRYGKNTIAGTLAGLQSADWIDKKTSAVFTEVSFYANFSHLVTSIFLAAEALSQGNVKVYYEINTFKPPYFYSYTDLTVAVLQFIHLTITSAFLYDVVRQCREVNWNRKGIFTILLSFWNFLACASALLSMCAYIFYLIFVYYSRVAIQHHKVDTTSFTFFSTPARYEKYYFTFLSFAAFVSCMRLVKVFRCSPTVTVMIDALSFAREELLNVSFSVFIFIVAFASLWTLMFGHIASDFLNFKNAIFSLYGIMSGFELTEKKPQSQLYLVIFALFMIMSIVVLINMYAVAVESGYIKMRVKLAERSWDPIETLSLLWLHDKLLMAFGVSRPNFKFFKVRIFVFITTLIFLK